MVGDKRKIAVVAHTPTDKNEKPNGNDEKRAKVAAVGSSGWQLDKTPGDCHKYMLSEGLNADFTFIFPRHGQQQLKAHKYMLVARSPVFEAQCSGLFIEKNSAQIIDISPETFLEMLRHIYYEGATLAESNIRGMMYAAKKYLLNGLVTACVEFIQNLISSCNVCTFFNLGLKYDDGLLAACVQYISQNISLILCNNYLHRLDQSGLHALITHPDMQNSPSDCFRVSVAWATQRKKQPEHAKKTLREILGSCLYQIGFISMKSEVLADTLDEEPGLLTVDEQAMLLRCVARPTPELLTAVRAIGFCNDTKYFETIRVTPSRFNDVHVDNEFRRDDTSDHWLDFSVSEPVVFCGVSIYRTVNFRNVPQININVTLTLYKKNQDSIQIPPYDKLVECQLSSLSFENGVLPMKLLLTKDKYTKLQKDNLYAVKVSSLKVKTYFGSQGMKSVAEEGVSFRYAAHSAHDTRTYLTRGQIPCLCFMKCRGGDE